MLHLLISVVGGELGALQTEVSRPNFMTQGVSPRRDGVYQPRPTRLKIAKQQQQNQQQGPLLRIQLPQGQARRQRKRSWQVRLLPEG